MTVDWSVVGVIAFVVVWLTMWAAILMAGACFLAGWIYDRWLR